jgi:hypothetical protein
MIATATLQTIWDCRWSRPGYRVLGVPDHLQPEKLWVCIRRGETEWRHRRGMRELPPLGGIARTDEVELSTRRSLCFSDWSTTP